LHFFIAGVLFMEMRDFWPLDSHFVIAKVLPCPQLYIGQR